MRSAAIGEVARLAARVPKCGLHFASGGRADAANAARPASGRVAWATGSDKVCITVPSVSMADRSNIQPQVDTCT